MDASPGKVLRDLVEDSTIQVPGAPNALMARLIERMDFDAVYLSGAALSAGVLGLPDAGLFTLTELAQQTAYITRNVDLPLIVDADTGFGEGLVIERAVAELEAAGAAAIQLEDRQLTCRGERLSGKSLFDVETMCGKLRTASQARWDDHLVIIGRTDARTAEGFEGAVERAQRYLAAGADWIFAEALTTREELARFAEIVDAPLVANMTEFGGSPLLTLEELADMGYAAVLYPVTLLRVTMKAAEAALAVLAAEGTQKDLLDLMQTREELSDLLDHEQFEERDRAYFSEEN
ncbi:MAG: isocitrate lyase/phosphoenolpyruvate mutase family protein [Pirellulaceae bacterium]